ncbi:hypothetical protein M2322_003664 [Rhodoblastus acidophilus]|uniref:hypothetical protein n=1 Tax=Rhodoblastus acidophilus TaxID=1074 RepID=UPI0022257132|nr:hypothetical protein [Rhodoblastus acidophilus]MCW2318097.1 hypothetical protein [Rhodoblastus acidophilus]
MINSLATKLSEPALTARRFTRPSGLRINRLDWLSQQDYRAGVSVAFPPKFSLARRNSGDLLCESDLDG